MNNDAKNLDYERKYVSLKSLYLDPNNFRLINEPEYAKVEDSQVKDKTVIRRTMRLLAGDKAQNLQDLLDSFRSNGYLPVDQIQVRELSDKNEYIVVEGNRRVAALKHLQIEFEEKGVELGKLEPEIFDKVPIVLYPQGDEIHHLTLMALKHISGNRKWAEWNQARLLQQLHDAFHLDEDEICRRIGITKVELRRSLRALSLVAQYQASDYGDQFNDAKFPIFREVVRDNSLKEWLGWNEAERKSTTTANLEIFFSWISREPINESDGDEPGGFGEKYLEPTIKRRDDIRILSKIVHDKKALDELKATRDINAAYRSSELIFHERQDAAVKGLVGDISTLSQMTIKSETLPQIEEALGRLQTVVERAKSSGLTGIEQKTVFHDRIDKHFSSIRIENYKRLKNIELHKISRINLVAGLNNTGKTSLLEAVYLLCRQNDFGGLFEIVRRRGKLSEDRLNPEWFVDQLVNQVSIGGLFDGAETQISISHYKEENSGIDKTDYLESVELASRFGEVLQESVTRLFSGRSRETQAGSIKLLCPSVFSSPFFLNEPHRYTAFYHKSTQSKSLPIIIKFIAEKIIPTVSDIRLVDKWQRFLVTDSIFDTATDLTEYGEGMQRIFFIALLFASAQNGVVLIDEFENAIHTELVSTFAEFVYELSNMFNVQVFLTSHSKECIDAFILNIPNVDMLSALSLVGAEGGISVREFSGPEIRRLVEAGNVDLRRAR